ncbi:MAG TPA: trigger factor [Bacteroidales bacterium]|nr:trigger factor [Bacteroidales bacterium]
MNIEQEKTGELTATIKVELEPADYQDKVDKQLKEYQRKANLPGFRPGHVPFGLVKKMYGKSLLYDVVNKTYSEALYKYISDNKINVLGTPLANEEKNKPLDLDNETNFSFWFDIAITPEFTPGISENVRVDHYRIMVTDETVDKYLNDMRKRYGTYEDTDTIEDGDMVSGDFAELDETGAIKTSGIFKQDTYIYLEYVKNNEIKDKFLGLKVGDFVDADPRKIARSNFEAAYFIGKKPDELDSINSLFRFTIKKITRNKAAELNEEFYKKVYPQETIENMDQLREQIRKDATANYAKECDRKFIQDASDAIRTSTPFELPEAFLKRLLLETSTDENLTKEKIEEDFEHHINVVKWQLIENKLISEHNLNVTEDEMKEFVKSYFRNTHTHDHDHEGENESDHEHDHGMDEKQLDQIAAQILKNEEEAKRISDKLFDDKLLSFMKNKLNVNYVDITYDEFIKIISTQKQ